MNFEKMKAIEPELSRLEASAQHAGEHGADWLDFIDASHQCLSKYCGSSIVPMERVPFRWVYIGGTTLRGARAIRATECFANSRKIPQESFFKQ